MLKTCVLLLFVVTGAVSLEERPQQDDCSSRLSLCTSGEKPANKKAVCGTDNQTYPSKCHLLHVQCQGLPVNIKHRGRCKEVQPCWMDLRLRRDPRQQQRAALGGSSDLRFVPTCLEDGTYAPVQCHAETGFCWCVTQAGKPLPNTSVKFALPNCARRGKSSPRRRSSPRGHRQKKGKGKSKKCERINKAQFNTNLIKMFKTEYNRKSPPPSTEDMQVDLERAVLNWKFSSLDLDGDDYLSSVEYKDLSRMVRKAVKPKKCSKVFTKLCDKDEDQRISRDEWAFCLGLDFNHESREDAGGERLSNGVLQESIPTITGSLAGFGDDTLDSKDEPEANDCLSDRQAVQEELLAGNTELYIPECTPDGRFQKTQCYKSTGYCWCVQEDGKPIPGTSIKNKDPNCDSVPTPSRPMPGCPEAKKIAFLEELMSFMTKKMQAATNKSSTTESNIPLIVTWDITAEEKVATWNFNALDKNNNKILEKKEWKNFRALISSNRQLRRCGKRLPRYCDTNRDRKISLSEWLNCLNAQRTNPTINVDPTPGSRRRGLNPLQIYLKD